MFVVKALEVAARVAALFVGYLGLALALTWPLGAHVTTDLPHVAGTFESDLYYAGWALAWQTHALATAPATLPHATSTGARRWRSSTGRRDSACCPSSHRSSS